MNEIIIPIDYESLSISHDQVLACIDAGVKTIITHDLTFFSFETLNEGYNVILRKKDGSVIDMKELLDNSYPYTDREIRWSHNILKLFLANGFEFKPKMEKKMKIFLGGTCNNSTWREKIKPFLTGIGVDYFDPIVPDWNEEAYKRELEERENCDKVLYVITPEMTGVYSIAEAVDDSNKRPDKTVFCVYDYNNTFNKGQIKSLDAVKKMVKNNGALVLEDLSEESLIEMFEFVQL